MKAVVHFDMELEPKTFDTFGEALDFVELRMREYRGDDPEMTLQWRRDDQYPNNYFPYTREQLVEEYNKNGEVILQLIGVIGEDLTVGEIANIITEEEENKDVAEAKASLDKLGQELANGYNTKISIGWEGKTFKPDKTKPKKLTRKRKKT